MMNATRDKFFAMRTANKNSEYDRPGQLAAANLQKLLEEERWSNRRAAMKMGVSPMYVNRRTNGFSEISISDIVAFAKLLGLTPDELVAALCAPWDLNPEPADYKTSISDTNVIVLPTRTANSGETADDNDTIADVVNLF